MKLTNLTEHTVEFLASELVLEDEEQPTIEELHVMQTGFTAGIKFINKLMRKLQ